MAGSDNVLAAILGVLEGSQKSADMFMQDAFARRRTREQQQYEMEQYPQKLKMQNEAKLSELQTSQPFLLEQARAKAQIEKPSDYVSGSDVLTGRPDLAGTIEPSAKMNK